MDSTPPRPAGKATRTLAAIVFTDVVNFSARMQAKETATLRLLQRDFAFMRKLAARHEGSVLKTTGDGLLLYFASAVQAVRCALTMQRHFAEQAKQLPDKEALAHRVGIHLGDVFVTAKEVMGDGVNIAARIQAEAEPGGVCISQTVYDVVKNKLALKVTNLGPRELKNITEAMPVYRILLEAQALESPSEPPFLASSGMTRPPMPDSPTTTTDTLNILTRLDAATRRLLFVGGVLAAVALIVIIAAVALIRRGRHRPETPRSPAEMAAEAGELEQEFTGRRMPMLSASRQNTRFLDDYDFAGLAQAVKDKSGDEPGRGAQLMIRSVEQLAELKEWLAVQLRRNYSRQKPLRVAEFTGDPPKETGVFVGPDRKIYLVQGGAMRSAEWTDLKPALVGAIIVSALNEAPPRQAATFILGAQAFAHLYNLPQMQEPLQALRRDRAARR